MSLKHLVAAGGGGNYNADATSVRII